jgi:hypothetical protein
LNGEANKARKRQNGAIIAADVRRFGHVINTDGVFGTHRLSLQAANGFRAAQLAYWIDGKPRADYTARWNLLDNVLRPSWRRL